MKAKKPNDIMYKTSALTTAFRETLRPENKCYLSAEILN